MSKHLKCVLYTRVSTDLQSENGTSLEAQRDACLQKAQSLEMQVVAIHTDEGVSGAKYSSRFGLQNALADIEEGRASILIAYDVSRLSRDRAHQDIIRKRVSVANGRLVFVTQTFENSADGELLFDISGDFAKYERRKIAERMMSGKRRRVEEGKQVNRAISPYGYHIVTRADVIRGDFPAEMAGQYVIVEETAHYVREIFSRYASGVSLRQIAMWLNTQGIPTARGGRQWEYKTIQLLLDNPTYKGKPYYGKLETLHDESLITERGRKTDQTFRIRPQEQWHWLTAPALVDEATWEACQERRKRNKEALSGNPRRKFLLTGLVRCPVCGYKMAGANKKGYKRKDGTQNMNQYYLCHPLRNGCPEKNYSVHQLVQATIVSLTWLVLHPALIAKTLRAYDQHRQSLSIDVFTEERARLEAERDKLTLKERKAAEAQVDALMCGRSTGVYDALLVDIDVRKAAIETRLHEIAPRTEPQSEPEPEEAADKLAKVAAAIVKVLTAPDEDYTLAEKQVLLSQIIESITPSGSGEVTIRLLSQTVKMIQTIQLTERLLLDNEAATATLVCKRANYPAANKAVLTTGGTGTSWASYASANSNPFNDIKNGKLAVIKGVAREPNATVLSVDAARVLADHPSVKDLVKYVHQDALTMSGLPKALRGLAIIEGAAQKNTAAEGAAYAGGNVWQADDGTAFALIFYRPEQPSLRTVSLGYTFEAPDDATGARGIAVRRWREEKRKGSMMEASFLRDWKLIAVDGSGLALGGYLLTSVTV